MSDTERAVQGIKDPVKRKEAFYSSQRRRAEEGGDQTTTDKIYGKMGKQSHSVDSSAVDKGILGTIPFLAAPEGKLLQGAAGAARSGLSKLIPAAEETAGKLVGRAAGAIGKASRRAPKTVDALLKPGKAAKSAASKVGKAVKSKVSEMSAKKAAGKKVKDIAKGMSKLERGNPATPKMTRTVNDRVPRNRMENMFMDKKKIKKATA